MNDEEPNTGQTPVGQLRSRALGRGHAYLGHRVLLRFGAAKDQGVLYLELISEFCSLWAKTFRFVGR